jgi:hypothetical protein
MRRSAFVVRVLDESQHASLRRLRTGRVAGPIHRGSWEYTASRLSSEDPQKEQSVNW